MGHCGRGIPSSIDTISSLSVRVGCAILVEKQSIFTQLVEFGLHEKLNCAIITGKGFIISHFLSLSVCKTMQCVLLLDWLLFLPKLLIFLSFGTEGLESTVYKSFYC